MLCKYEVLADFNLAVAKIGRQTAKFNSLPYFPAVRVSASRYAFCKRISTQSQHAYGITASTAQASRFEAIYILLRLE